MEDNRTDNAARLLVVLMTAPDRDEASRIAEMLVSSCLAACVQVLPEIQSVYRWKGEIERASETLLLNLMNWIGPYARFIVTTRRR